MSLAHKEFREDWCCYCNKIVKNLKEHARKHKTETEECQLCHEKVTRTRILDHLRLHSRNKLNLIDFTLPKCTLYKCPH